jgi:hypothetical protein
MRHKKKFNKLGNLNSWRTKYIKASRKGSREAELENENGWVAKNKVYKSKKNYTRKSKHKNSPLV